MLACQHLTTADQRIKLAKRVLSLLPSIATRKMRHACMSAFDDRRSANKTREARFIAVAKYSDEENAACLHVGI